MANMEDGLRNYVGVITVQRVFHSMRDGQIIRFSGKINRE